MFNIKGKLVEFFSKSNVSNILLLVIFLLSSLILFVPIEYLIYSLITITWITLFIIKPEYSFYLFILCIPFVRPNLHYLHFQDAFIFICFVCIIINIIIKRYKVINISTKLDKWLIIIILLFIIKGFTSIAFFRGALHCIRFIEAIVLFYMTVYFIRIHRVKISTIIKILILTTVFQAFLGVVQSLTNSFGVQDYSNDRGYFGYLGIGSKVVYSGRGTFWHFAAYGYFITSIFLFLLPFYKDIIKKKWVFNIIFFVLLMGIIFSYSRGALTTLIVGIAYYFYVMEPNKKSFLLKLIFMLLVISPLILFFLGSDEYVSSLNPRDKLWAKHIMYLTDHFDELIWGAGFESREYTYFPYAPPYLRNPGDFNPHNLLLTYVEEIGIVGTFIYLSFWIKIILDSLKQAKIGDRLDRIFSIGLQLILLSVIYSGINDHIYHDPYLNMFLFLMIGIFYAKYDYLFKKTA